MKIKQPISIIGNSLYVFVYTIMLCSCALLGPDYKKPKVDTPNKWQESAINTTITESAVNISQDPWWKKFNDPTLNHLMEEALANNNDIQTAIGNITVAAGNLQQIKMAWVPTIVAGGNYGFAQTFNNTNSTSSPAFSGSNNSNALNNSGNNFNFYNLGLIPSYSINIFQQIKKVDVAKANLKLAKANKDAVRLTIISQLSGSYFTLLAINNEIENQKKLINHLNELLNLIKIQYKYGLATSSDINNYQEKLSQAKMQLPNMEHDATVTQNAIQVLVNKNFNPIGGLNQFSKIIINAMIPINLPSQVLHDRPDIEIAEDQLKVANGNIGVATANFFPNINLTTPIGAYNAQLGNLFTAGGDFWATQITATMPILNLGLIGLIKQSKGQYYVSYYNYVKAVKSAFGDVNNSLSQYEKIQKVYANAMTIYNSTNSNAQLNALNYKNGYISYPSNLSSQIDLDNVKILLSQTKLQELQAIISLYQSLAAGYNYKNTDTPIKFGDSHDT